MSYVLENDNFFVSIEEGKKWILDHFHENEFRPGFFNYLLVLLFIQLKENGTYYIPKDELPIYLKIFRLNTIKNDCNYSKFYYEDYNLLTQVVKITSNTVIYFPCTVLQEPVPAFVRNLFRFSLLKCKDLGVEKTSSVFELMGIVVVTYDAVIKDYLSQASLRKERIDRLHKSTFVNSASYMGSKKKISGFLIESMAPHISKSEVFLDLMCGAGSMSQAFAQFGLTYASDAELFCRLLARIQGHGFTKERALSILNIMKIHYQRNLKELLSLYSKSVDLESKLYSYDWSDTKGLFSMYREFEESFPLYSSDNKLSGDLTEYIGMYKLDNRKHPYCLLTLYYSNIFFGLSQCIQLDSLRYAIDQLNHRDKEWALGVLIVTANQISSNHAGHFAQPKRVTESNIVSVLLERQRSAYHEFDKRLICLSQESELCPNVIHTISGPWETALEYANKNIRKKVAVYLDAPYKRDEYSRYYHVLETLAKYDYPSSEGKGRIRSKRLGERFSTEFFTKNRNKIINTFISIITKILSYRMICVWSYSDNGDASIIEVINSVRKAIPCRIHIYSTSYTHHSQRRNRSSRSVIEYCIIFIPD